MNWQASAPQLLLEVFNSIARGHAGTDGRVAQQRLGWWFGKVVGAGSGVMTR